jgi:solute:Na+ symporter, SSS family
MDIVTVSVFLALILLVTGMGFVASRWRQAKDLNSLDEWALGGRGFGGFITWFLLGGDLYSAYTLIAVPAAVFSIGAFGFYAVPNAVILYSLGFLFLPKLVQLAHRYGYVTLTDFVQHRFNSRGLGLVITLTGLLATLPYLALQLIGLEVIFSAMGIEAAEDASWFMKDLPLFIAFAVLAAYTYTSGIRAPALIAFVKDALTYVFVLTAVIYIPIKLGGFTEIFNKAGQVIAERTGSPNIAGAVTSVDPSVYMTLALGSGMAFFLYPHAITGVFAARSAQTVRRNMAVLPIYTVLLGLVALLGFMALAAGIEPKDGNPQFAVPQLVQEMFPSWFVGVAFAAIAMSALVPAAIMAIGAGNLVSRNLVREFSTKELSAHAETQLSKIVSVLVKLGALVFVLSLDSQFALNFQLLGGIWMLQTLPAVIFGLFLKRYANKVGLIAGWACGFTYGTVAAYGVESVNTAHFGGSTAIPFFLTSPIYIAISGLIINLVVTAVVCGMYNLLRDGTLAGSNDDVDETGTNAKAATGAQAVDRSPGADPRADGDNDDIPERVPSPAG